jgi:hypothetical protein
VIGWLVSYLFKIQKEEDVDIDTALEVRFERRFA